MNTALLSKVKIVCFDIDDTFSWEGKIPAEAYSALWSLQEAGIKTVPVTGRPAGWCDLIARMWPVSAVVGENGAFYISEGKKFFLESEKLRIQNSKKRETLRRAVLKRFPEARHPTDQGYREFDFAIDTCEDVRPWSDKRIQELIRFCSERGAHAKVSSIHVNVWYGEYDKWTCASHLLKTKFKVKDWATVAYLGDSPNDEPFFEKLSMTIGVANVLKFLTQMKFQPRHITRNPGGHGFSEFVQKLLRSQA